MPIKIDPRKSGYGDPTGGRNGLVIFINDNTDATSRAAWQNTQERIIIPRINSYIELTSRLSVDGASRGNFTYMGEFCNAVYKNYEVRIATVSNFAITNLKSRKGDRNKEVSTASGDAFSLDTLSNAGAPSQNFYIANSVFSWSTDETFSLANSMNGTVQYCLIYEPLDRATISEKGTPHGFGSLIGSKEISMHHNLYAFMRQRVPLLQNNRQMTGDVIDLRNNAFYAWHANGFEVAGECKSVNFIKNSLKKKTGYTGLSPTGIARFKGSVADDTPRIYLQGNKLREWNGVNTVPSLTDDPSSQRNQLFGSSTAISNAMRTTVGVLTPFTLPVGLYDFDETVDQSDLLITERAGTLYRDPIDQRVINDWLTGAALIRGGTTNVFGLIDKPEDSKHFESANVGYPTIPNTPQILDGPSPHYLPTWFISKYSLTSYSNYHLAGTPITRPENFIRFKDGLGIQLSQDVSRGSIDYANDLIYRGYEVLKFNVTGAINLLEVATFTLTVNSATGGTSNISSGSFAPSANVNLVATPSTGFIFTRWEQLIVGVWTQISTSANFNFLMPSVNTSVRPVFTAIPTYTLSVSALANGTTNISTATETAGTSIALSAIPDMGYRYDKWERLEGVTWVDLLALQSFNFIMPDASTSVRASFVLIDEPTVPPIATGDRFFARFQSEPIV